MRVELYTAEGKVGEYHLVADRVVATTPQAEKAIDGLTVVEPGTLAKLTTDDGERYLRALTVTLSGTYAWAKLVD